MADGTPPKLEDSSWLFSGVRQSVKISEDRWHALHTRLLVEVPELPGAETFDEFHKREIPGAETFNKFQRRKVPGAETFDEFQKREIPGAETFHKFQRRKVP